MIVIVKDEEIMILSLVLVLMLWFVLLGFWIRTLADVWFPAKMERFRTTQNNPPAVVPRYLIVIVIEAMM